MEQIVEPGQTEAIAWAIRGILEKLADGITPLVDLTGKIVASVADDGLDVLTAYGAKQWPAHLAEPRAIDVGAALNRHRGLRLAVEPARPEQPEESEQPGELAPPPEQPENPAEPAHSE